MEFMQIEFRLWLFICGYLGTIIGAMLLFGVLIWLVFQKGIQKSKEKGNSVRGLTISQYIIVIIFGFFCLVALFLIGFFSLFYVREERVSADGQLMVAYGNFLSESYWYDYDRVSFWGRKPAYGVEEIQMLEEKYQREFTLNDIGMDIGRLTYIPEDYPDINVLVYDISEQKDDFLERYIDQILYQAYGNAALTQTSQIRYENSEMGNFSLLLKEDQTDILSFSKDVAKLITGAIQLMQKDSNLPTFEGSLYIKIESIDQSDELLEIPFGITLSLENGQSGIYYADYENVYEKITEYMSAYGKQVILPEDETTGKDDYTNEDDSVEVTQEDNIEELAYAVYEQELIQKEDNFEFTYNAKGNPYVILGSGEGQLDGQTIQIRRTLVYDRTSKNGKCEIFVYYEEHYDMDGNQQDNTTILNMYAVDKETKTVYTADRFAWADVGNETYRKAVGE